MPGKYAIGALLGAGAAVVVNDMMPGASRRSDSDRVRAARSSFRLFLHSSRLPVITTHFSDPRSVAQLPRPSPVPNTTDALPRLGLSTPKNINLQYFDIMGPTERIRYALLLGKVPFNDERVKFSDWPSVKPTTPYGQMPVLTVDGQRFTQSGAILNWAGTITGLTPRDPIKAMRVNEACELDNDLRGKIRPSIYVGMDKSLGDREKKRKVKEMREEIAKTHIPFYLGHFEKMLEDSEYLCGDKVTVADCQVLSTLRWLGGGGLDHIPPTCVEAFPKLCALKKKMEAMPEIAEYLEKTKK
jgi:glutathione S-transferase|tara:strand:+ start:568 stop:1467 length:900 start_codon:yes stop_codon:yes gene_type:complete